MVKRPKEKFYHLRITKSEGPYLDWSAAGLTDDPRCAFIGNAKHIRYAQATYPLAWVMERVPSVKRRARP